MNFKFINISKPTGAAKRFKHQRGIREPLAREEWTAYVRGYSNEDDLYGVVGICTHSFSDAACSVDELRLRMEYQESRLQNCTDPNANAQRIPADWQPAAGRPKEDVCGKLTVSRPAV